VWERVLRGFLKTAGGWYILFSFAKEVEERGPPSEDPHRIVYLWDRREGLRKKKMNYCGSTGAKTWWGGGKVIFLFFGTIGEPYLFIANTDLLAANRST